MSVFNLNIQNQNADNKIVAGLERLSHVFKVLLWEKAKEYSLSPIQIQILIFIQYHRAAINTVSYLAKEFNITKPTISDAVKVLEQKGLIVKTFSSNDSRSYSIALTDQGKNTVEIAGNFPDPLLQFISAMADDDKELFWKNIVSLITLLNRTGVISVQRMCTGCIHYRYAENIAWCSLLKQELEIKDLRIDCPEFSPAKI